MATRYIPQSTLDRLERISGSSNYIDRSTGELYRYREVFQNRTGQSPEQYAASGISGRASTRNDLIRQWQEGRSKNGLDTRVRGNNDGARDFREFKAQLKLVNTSGKTKKQKDNDKKGLWYDYGIFDIDDYFDYEMDGDTP